MYKNIVFDMGGVVINYAPRDYLTDQYFHEATENILYDAVFGSEEWRQLDRGEISFRKAADIFLERGRENDVAFEMQALIDNWTEMLTPKKATVKLINIFKQYGYKVYYLTNMARETLAYLNQREFFAPFDGGIASCEIGICKPDPGIYRALLDKYQLIPQETIFADDMPVNASAAFQAGITGIHFKNVKNFCQTLVSYGIEI